MKMMELLIGWCTSDNPQMINPGTGNKRTSRDQPDYKIINIGQNTEKSLGDLRKFAITQTPVKNHQLTLEYKALKGVNDNNNL